ncbi:MAG TPA: hypothetical protein PLW19_07505 [Anaerolineaceae bacterium]|nr:hypothetical protein [Anaerolineaceae bacterium]
MKRKEKLVSQINCDNCGAPLQPKWGEQVHTCPFCKSVQHLAIDWKDANAEKGTSFSVAQSGTVSSSDTKGAPKPQGKDPLSIVMKVLFFIVFFIILSLILYTALRMFGLGPFQGGFPRF